MNDLITNGEAKTDEPKNLTSHLDRMESTLSYVIGQLVEHHVQKAVKAKFEAVVLVNDQLEGEVDELKENLVSADTVKDLINERLDERDAERDDAIDASEYVKVEDLADAVRDEISNLPDTVRDVMTDAVRDIVTNDLTFNVDVS